MFYLWMKALHVAAVLLFVGGLLAQSLILSNLVRSASAGWTQTVAGLRRWDKLITSPALLLVWALGITIAVSSGSFQMPWLKLKLILVVALSGLHGVQAGVMRKAATNAVAPPSWIRWSPLFICVATGIVALLAVTKLP